MRFVHETENNLRLAGVLGGDLAPKTSEIGVADSAVALTNNVAVPTSVIVDIDDTVGTGSETALYELVVLGPVAGI